MARVSVRPQGVTVEAEMGGTILQAALAAGIDFPNSCQSGNCGACKCKLVSGEVDMMPYSPYALSDAERAGGMILACRAMAWEDCEIALIEAHPHRRIRARVAGIEKATHDVAVLRLVHDEAPLEFTAGQFVRLEIAGLEPRDYSMASRPGDDVLEFHVRKVPGGAVSGHVHDALKEGDPVVVEGPFGDCRLHDDHAGPIVAVAGGSGLAPIKSIVETALAKGMDNPIHLYFGVRARRDVYLADHFRALAARHPNLRFEVVLSEEDAPGWRHGLVTEALNADAPDLAGAKAYVCGPPPMVDAAMRALAALGVPEEDRHADAFTTRADTGGA